MEEVTGNSSSLISKTKSNKASTFFWSGINHPADFCVKKYGHFFRNFPFTQEA